MIPYSQYYGGMPQHSQVPPYDNYSGDTKYMPFGQARPGMDRSRYGRYRGGIQPSQSGYRPQPLGFPQYNMQRQTPAMLLPQKALGVEGASQQPYMQQQQMPQPSWYGQQYGGMGGGQYGMPGIPPRYGDGMPQYDRMQMIPY